MVPNYYNLSGKATRVIYYAESAGPLVAGTPPKRPALEYISGSLDVSVSGSDLSVVTTPVGTIVTALVKRSGLPGANTFFSLLIPDANLADQSVTINTIGVLSVAREVSNIGPGQRETYTEVPLTGTAANIVQPAAATSR
jgi:hypothetical protein